MHDESHKPQRHPADTPPRRSCADWNVCSTCEHRRRSRGAETISWYAQYRISAVQHGVQIPMAVSHLPNAACCHCPAAAAAAAVACPAAAVQTVVSLHLPDESHLADHVLPSNIYDLHRNCKVTNSHTI